MTSHLFLCSLILPLVISETQSPGRFVFFQPHALLKGSVMESSAELTRLSQFKWLLTNGYETLPAEKRRVLEDAGGRLFLYFWANGFYEWESEQDMPDGSWRREVREKHPDWLLNPGTPERGNGAVQPAFFLDLAVPELRQYLVKVLASSMDRTGYDGVFFDYAGSYALPGAVLDLYGSKHPDLSYDAALGRLFHGLRTEHPSITIFTNQAYRATDAPLKWVDLDLAESVATSFLWGKEITVLSEAGEEVKTCETFYRPWDGPNGIRSFYEEILRKRRECKAETECLTLNYVKATWEPTGETVEKDGRKVSLYRRVPDRSAIFYGYVAAKLFSLDGYSSDWYDVGSRDDEPFLLHLGRAQGDLPEDTEGVVVRYFDRGFVVLSKSGKPVDFDLASERLPVDLKGLRDVFEKRTISASQKSCRIQIQPTLYAASGSTYPCGRVFLYVE